MGFKDKMGLKTMPAPTLFALSAGLMKPRGDLPGYGQKKTGVGSLKRSLTGSGRKNILTSIQMEAILIQVKRRLFARFILIILFLSFLSGCDRPQMTGVESDEIDTSQDPIQMLYKADEPMTREVKNGYFMITPVAEYKISGVVVGKATYSSDWDGEISPVDLAIAWGKLAEPGSNRHITYTQGYRWYFYQYKAGSPFDNSYIVSHSSNNHIIPANENIRRAVKAVKKKDKIVLEGFLVNLRGTYKERPITWNTSLSRTDTGNGSCELFYVSKVRIDTKVYE